MQLPIFDVIMNEGEIGLTAVSFVDEPAICQDFVYFRKEKDSSIWFNKVKHEVISPLLIPNQLILRYDRESGQKYYMRWSKETIFQVASKFLLNQFQNNVTINHPMQYDDSLTYEDCLEEGVYMLEMWIIEDAKTDVMNTKYGYHLPEGTLCCHYKIYNRRLWNMIVNGEVKGLSIEAFCSIAENKEKINYSKMFKYDRKQMTLMQKFVQFLNEISDEAKELADVAKADETSSGEVSLKYYTNDTDYIEVLTDGSCVTSDGTEVIDGEYPLQDGNILVVEGGKFSCTKEADEAVEEEPIEAPIAEETQPKDDEEPKEEDVEATPDEDEPEKKDEEIKEEEDELPYTLVDVEVNGVTYKVPQEVYDYIKTLEGDKEAAVEVTENFKKEIAKMQSRIPSTQKAEAKINQNKVVESKEDNLLMAISLLNKRK